MPSSSRLSSFDDQPRLFFLDLASEDEEDKDEGDRDEDEEEEAEGRTL